MKIEKAEKDLVLKWPNLVKC